MRLFTKPVLLSALVFPGAGHLYLKKYVRAALFILVSLFALSFILAEAISHAQVISAQILSGELRPDANTILEAVRSRPVSKHLFTINCILFIIWLIAIIDAYRNSKKLTR